MAELSLIIVTYNSSKHIYDCLDSVFSNNDIGDGLEVIIVDNASEGQADMFAKLSTLYADKVLLKNSGKNGGYGYGNNIGIKEASAPVVIVMNPDVRLVCPIFQQLLLILKDSSIGMVGVDFIDGSVPYYFKIEHYTLWHELFLRFYVKKKKYDSKKMYLSGCFLVFNKKAFFDSGAFDENIFMYCEEADITNRMLNNKYIVEWHKEILVRHLPHKHVFNKDLERILYKSQAYYCKKYNLPVQKFFKQKLNVLIAKMMTALVLFDKERFISFKQKYRDLNSYYKSIIVK